MLLKVGSRGDAVKALQRFLGLPDDGIFGTNTEKEVKKWQSENGLNPDGMVGDKTISKMGLKFNRGLDLTKLKSYLPIDVYEVLPDIVEQFEIDTVLRMAHFLAQCAHESGGFKIVEENLNYSADGLMKVFGKYFPTIDIANEYARKPQKIANRVYANRMGNGDEASGDGWRYRGRGYIQCTGKNNYEDFNDFMDCEDDMVKNPELVANYYPLDSAAWFWYVNELSELADNGSDDETVKRITKRVNGGYNGLDDRIQKFKKFYGALSS